MKSSQIIYLMHRAVFGRPRHVFALFLEVAAVPFFAVCLSRRGTLFRRAHGRRWRQNVTNTVG
jgi:hypothetical protein